MLLEVNTRNLYFPYLFFHLLAGQVKKLLVDCIETYQFLIV